MSAIKKLFDHNREVARLRKERAIERQRKLEKPVEIVVDTTYEDNLLKEELSYLNQLLYRDWFVDDDDIIDLLEDASERAYNSIVENLKTYPERVQNVIIDNYIPQRLSDKKVKELTDHDMIQKYMQTDQDYDNKIEAAWQKEIKESGISRPDGELEDALEEKTEELANQKQLLEQEKNKKQLGTYVPPSMRHLKKIENPVVTKLEETIKNIENEIARLKKQIQQEEKSWYAERKSEFTFKWLSVPSVS
jgi:hypothetical protein